MNLKEKLEYGEVSGSEQFNEKTQQCLNLFIAFDQTATLNEPLDRIQSVVCQMNLLQFLFDSLLKFCKGNPD